MQLRRREQKPNVTGPIFSLVGSRHLATSVVVAVLFLFNILYFIFESSTVLLPVVVNYDIGNGPPNGDAAPGVRSSSKSIGSIVSTMETGTGVAYNQSFGLLDDISDPMWERMRNTAKTTSWYANPDNPLHQVDQEVAWLGSNMNPNFNCPHVERVGEGEGTKFLCYPHRLVRDDETNKKDCLVYSVGCAGDFNFEDAMSKKYNKECEIHIFDPANWTRPNDVQEKNIHYHPWGLLSTYNHESKSVVWPKGYGGVYKTFPETIELLGHQDRTIDIFKIDCEGCEWTTHKDWIGFGKYYTI